ncbi:MAG: NHL repeat-containing protein [Clostridia bacterium]|nr:NHL repeat-containing protein [Clostridia bacterium]
MKYKKLLKTVLASLLLMTVLSISAFANTAYKTITVDKNGDYIETQNAYNPVMTIEKIDNEILSKPGDMTISGEKLYIADTGNKRIVISTLEGSLISVISSEFLKQPCGIFVAENGEILVADMEAEAVFAFTEDGVLQNKYEKPTSVLYGEKESFIPLKVACDGNDNLYISCKGNSNGIVQISRSTGEFLGYFGANEVTISLWDRFLDSIFTEEQKSQLQQTIPASISNLTVDSTGIVYTMTNIETDQVIRKLNMSANDMLKTDISFPSPSDLTIGSIGNIYASTSNGYILEFNSEGDLLFIFGGFDDGSQRIGLFSTISAIAVTENGRLYVLDDTTGQIQTFEPTEFTENVHTALALYQDGKYIESKEPWEKVLLMNNLFDYAHKGIAESYYMEENYAEAMKHFELSNDKEGVSKAFTELRNAVIRKNIFWILGIAVVVLGGGYVLLMLRRKTKVLAPAGEAIRKVSDKPLLNQLFFLFKIPKNPIDAYYGIKRENKVSVKSATILYSIFVVIYLADKYLRGYIFSTITVGQYSVIKDAAVILGILILIILAHYLICSITEGEASLKNVYCAIVYSLMPYIILRPVVIILTHILTDSEVFIINFLNVIIYVCTIALLVVMVNELNNYKASETVKCIFWTLFAFFVAIVVLFILYVMTKQTAEFVVQIWSEVIYRVQG